MTSWRAAAVDERLAASRTALLRPIGIAVTRFREPADIRHRVIDRLRLAVSREG
jgi:hypothetical protein